MIQGELTYRIVQPKRVAEVLDYSVDARGNYRSEDPTKLNDRLVHASQVLAKAFVQRFALRELLVKSSEMTAEVAQGMGASEAVTRLGIEVLDVSILGIKSNPEMSKALQAGAREELLRKADEAVFARRNASVEMERSIKENELKTEIAVEQKKREVRETQMSTDIALEAQRATLVDSRTENERKEAESRAFALQQILDPLKSIDWKTLMAAGGGGDAKLNIALAFRELAENAEKIGQLNISPDLLAMLTQSELPTNPKPHK
ncbi:MAG: protein/band 7 family protein [Pirellulaceae bacterium]|nr:protein/band 7 family protein [Pirellulaceae bacterium]